MGRKRHTPKPKMGEITRSPDGDDVEWVSKSEMKREAARLEQLAARLVAARKDDLAALELPDDLAPAVHEARRLTHADARQRQIRHLARLLQGLDSDPIAARLDLLDPSSETGQQVHRLTEQWRDRLNRDSAAVTELLTQFPDSDHQALRQAIRNAHKAAHQAHHNPDNDAAQAAHRRQQRQLYQRLHPLVQAQIRQRL